MIPIKHDRNSGYFIWVSGVVRGKKNTAHYGKKILFLRHMQIMVL